jgi:hypothetical protein
MSSTYNKSRVKKSKGIRVTSFKETNARKAMSREAKSVRRVKSQPPNPKEVDSLGNRAMNSQYAMVHVNMINSKDAGIPVGMVAFGVVVGSEQHHVGVCLGADGVLTTSNIVQSVINT